MSLRRSVSGVAPPPAQGGLGTPDDHSQVVDQPGADQVGVFECFQAGDLEQTQLVADVPDPVVAGLHLPGGADLQAVEDCGDQPVGQPAQAGLAVDGHCRRRQAPPLLVAAERAQAPFSVEPPAVELAVDGPLRAAQPVTGGNVAGAEPGQPCLRGVPQKVLHGRLGRCQPPAPMGCAESVCHQSGRPLAAGDPAEKLSVGAVIRARPRGSGEVLEGQSGPPPAIPAADADRFTQRGALSAAGDLTVRHAQHRMDLG